MSAAPALLPIFVIAFIALVALGVFFTLLVAVFRAATRSSARPPTSSDAAPGVVPPILGSDDSFTNPANPLYHMHHPSTSSHSPTHFDAAPSHSPSFDSGSSASAPSFDASSASTPSCDSGGAGCG